MQGMAKILKQGEGWRVGYDPAQSAYPFLIGGADWAVELTQAEFTDFQRLTAELSETVTLIAPELMAEETIQCNLENENIWLEVSGLPDAYELRWILQQGRRAEGTWPAAIVADLLMAIAQITVF